MGSLAIAAVVLRFVAKSMRGAKSSGIEDISCVVGLVRHLCANARYVLC